MPTPTDEEIALEALRDADLPKEYVDFVALGVYAGRREERERCVALAKQRERDNDIPAACYHIREVT